MRALCLQIGGGGAGPAFTPTPSFSSKHMRLFETCHVSTVFVCKWGGLRPHPPPGKKAVQACEQHLYEFLRKQYESYEDMEGMEVS